MAEFSELKIPEDNAAAVGLIFPAAAGMSDCIQGCQMFG